MKIKTIEVEGERPKVENIILWLISSIAFVVFGISAYVDYNLQIIKGINYFIFWELLLTGMFFMLMLIRIFKLLYDQKKVWRKKRIRE